MYVKIINDVGMVQLQHAVTAPVDWARQWQFAIFIEKCCVLNIRQHTAAPQITVDNCILPIVPQTRDLGVVVCRHL